MSDVKPHWQTKTSCFVSDNLEPHHVHLIDTLSTIKILMKKETQHYIHYISHVVIQWDLLYWMHYLNMFNKYLIMDLLIHCFVSWGWTVQTGWASEPASQRASEPAVGVLDRVPERQPGCRSEDVWLSVCFFEQLVLTLPWARHLTLTAPDELAVPLHVWLCRRCVNACINRCKSLWIKASAKCPNCNCIPRPFCQRFEIALPVWRGAIHFFLLPIRFYGSQSPSWLFPLAHYWLV